MHAIGVDLGGTKISAALVSVGGDVFTPRDLPTPKTAGDIINAVIKLCRDLRAYAVENALGLLGIGIATAGQVDTTRGVITYANRNLPEWTGAPIAERIARALDLPVTLDNDVNVLALSEGVLGAGRSYEHILYMTVGTGVGGALTLNGRLWRGAHFSAGEIGYLVAGWSPDGMPITVEQVASGKGIERAYQARARATLDLRAITQRAEAGERDAIHAITEGARALAHVITPLIIAIDPQIMIVGGGVAQIGALWWSPFVDTIRACPLPTAQQIEIAPAQHRAHAGVVGAGLLALHAETTP